MQSNIEISQPQHAQKSAQKSIFASRCKLDINIRNIENIVLSGGGLLGISYVGMVRYLEEENIIPQIRSITGCSAGSIFAVLIALGYKSDELTNIITKLKFSDYVDINAESIINFTRNKGLDSGIKLMSFIKKLIADKNNNNPEITFKEIYDRYNIKIQICATNINTMTLALFNKDSAPDMPVCTAIRASTALPLIYEPVIINDSIYCDGGVINNMPMCLACLDVQMSTVINSSDLAINISSLPDDRDKDRERDRDKDREIEVLSSVPTNSNTVVSPHVTRKLTGSSSANGENNGNTNAYTNSKSAKTVMIDGLEYNQKMRVKMDTNTLDKTLGFYLTNEYLPLPKGSSPKDIAFSNYLDRIFQSFGNAKMNTIRKYSKNIILLEVPNDIMSIMKIYASNIDTTKTINIAYDTIKTQMKKCL